MSDLEIRMNYMPIEILSPVKLSDVQGPALVLPGNSARGEAFLVTGADPSFACFLTGDHVGSGFEKASARNWSGLAVEGIRFEVDAQSKFRPAYIDQPLGAIIRGSQGLELIISLAGGRGFAEATRVALTEGIPGTAEDLEVGFTRWRAVIGQGVEAREIFKFEATKTANF
jgi:hypothetical protein